jgi:hypothetical protein
MTSPPSYLVLIYMTSPPAYLVLLRLLSMSLDAHLRHVHSSLAHEALLLPIFVRIFTRGARVALSSAPGMDVFVVLAVRIQVQKVADSSQ